MRKDQWDMTTKFGKGRILAIIGDSPGVSAKEIERELNGSSALIGRNIRMLVADGYIERDYRMAEGNIANKIVFVYYLSPEGRIRYEDLTR